MRWSLQSHNRWAHYSYRVGVEEWLRTIPAIPTPRLIAMICPLDRELREANKTSSTYHYLRRFQQMLLLSPVQTEATCLANNSQHFWMLYVASVCTSRCILMRVVGICCAKFETGQTFSYVQTHATTYNIVGSTMLGVASVYTWL